MKIKTILTLFVAAAFTACPNLQAQNLPKMKPAADITAGKLPNGVSYYLVTNQAATGLADYALVQKHICDTALSRVALNDLPHFRHRKTWKYLADHGIAYSADGIVSHTGQATVFRFNDVPVSSQATADSTLLMLFDLALSSPYDEAIIISGDIVPAKYTERMQMLSMLLPQRTKPASPATYSWAGSDERRFSCTDSRAGSTAEIRLDYSMPRTPDGLMGTAQPLVSKMFTMELSDILRARAEQTFRMSRIPLADISCTHRGSDAGPGDEHFIIQLSTDADKTEEALRAIAGILSDIDRGGVSPNEFRNAKTRIVADLMRKATVSGKSNHERVDMCTAAFLYGASLASEETNTAFFSNKRLEDNVEIDLFRNYVTAMLDSHANLAMSVSAPYFSKSGSQLQASFEDAWNSALSMNMPPAADTLSLTMPGKKKVQVKASIQEPVTGGVMWTFSNGMKAVYKKAPTKGQFQYAFMVKGGFGHIQAITQGESIFIGDLLMLGKVAGMSSTEFESMLRDNGITMQGNVSRSDMRMTGYAPSSKLQLLLKSFLSIASDREPDQAGFDWYRLCEAQRIKKAAFTDEGVFGFLDSTIDDNTTQSNRKDAANLHDDLQKRAETYFEHQFDNLGNTLMVFYGDLDEAELKKQLCRYLGSLNNGSQRPLRSQNPRMGREAWYSISAPAESSRYGDGSRKVYMEITSAIQTTAADNATLEVAGLALKRRLVKTLAGLGCRAEVEAGLDMFPTDRASIRIVCTPCQAEGLPEGIEPARMTEALNAVRAAVNSMATKDVTAAELKECKAILTNLNKDSLKNGSVLIDAVLKRNSEGKDVVTGYKERIGAVSAADVRKMFAQLDRTKLEYTAY